MDPDLEGHTPQDRLLHLEQRLMELEERRKRVVAQGRMEEATALGQQIDALEGEIAAAAERIVERG